MSFFDLLIISDLERHWTLKIGVVSEFFTIFAAAHISRVSCNKLARDDRPGQTPTKFLALNVHFNSPSFDPTDSRRLAHLEVKQGYPRKSGYFTAICSSAWKQLQIGTDMLLIITSTGNELFNGVNVNDFERTLKMGDFSVFFGNFWLLCTF